MTKFIIADFFLFLVFVSAISIFVWALINLFKPKPKKKKGGEK